MRPAIAAIIVLAVTACTGPQTQEGGAKSRSVRDEPLNQPPTGLTISGHANIGVSKEF